MVHGCNWSRHIAAAAYVTGTPALVIGKLLLLLQAGMPLEELMHLGGSSPEELPEAPRQEGSRMSDTTSDDKHVQDCNEVSRSCQALCIASASSRHF